MSEKLAKMGFRKADDSYTPHLIMSLCGMEKQGKTHFSLTAPGPIAVFNCDIGLEGVVQKFVSDKDIHIYDFDIPRDSGEAKDRWQEYQDTYYKLLKGRDVRTIIHDTATETWELLRMAEFGQLTQVMPYHYGPVNAIYRRMIRDAYKTDKNLILLHKMKPVYINDKRTSDYERSGFGDTGYLVQVNAQIYMYDKTEDEDEHFVLFIKDSRHDPALANTELEGPMCNFPTLAMLAYPDSDPEDWE